MTENSTPAQGIMFKFTYKSNPKHEPDRVFDVVRFFAGTDATKLGYAAKNHAMNSGALAVTTLTEEQYKELINEEAKRTQTETVTAETHQA
jgi:hypothetical protein